MSIDEAIKHAEEVAESQEYEGKKLEESGEKYHDEYENYCASQCFECAKQHRQYAEWLKELKQLREQTSWIPISERLPEEFESVLVCYKSQGGMAQCVTERFVNMDGRSRWSAMYGQEPIAWMPLPKPYKKKARIIMKPLNCCKGCKGLNENGEFKNKLRCLFSCNKYALEHAKSLYDEQKADKGCSTCRYCEHVCNYPGYVTAEESTCKAGLECDTVLFTVKNCPKWVGEFESEGKE